jgi:hypothetical protein
VRAEVLRAGVAAPFAEESGHGLLTASGQGTAEDVARGGFHDVVLP